MIRAYTWDANGRQVYVKTGASAYYLIANPHGDNVAIASASALVGTEHYDPWGSPTYAPSGTTTPFSFQGAFGSWTDQTSGLVAIGARWYYPKTGLFLSSDPAAGTANPRTPITGVRWAYAGNNPLTQNDPTGLRILTGDEGVVPNPQPNTGNWRDWENAITDFLKKVFPEGDVIHNKGLRDPDTGRLVRVGGKIQRPDQVVIFTDPNDESRKVGVISEAKNGSDDYNETGVDQVNRRRYKEIEDAANDVVRTVWKKNPRDR